MGAQDEAEEDRRFAYHAEWNDQASGMVMALTMLHWPHREEVELIDAKKRKTFMKRLRCDGVGAAPLRPGTSVLVMSRRLQILAPADATTRAALAAAPATRTFAMVKPDAVQHLGEVLAAAQAARLAVVNLRLARLTAAEAAEFYAVHRERPFFPKLLEFMTSGPVVAMELEGADAVAAWRRLLGPTDTAAARDRAPASMRARFGTDNTRNACHGSDAEEAAAQEAAFFFGGRQSAGRVALPPEVDITLAVIKPHAVAAGLAGPILEALQRRFRIVAAEGVRLQSGQAEAFHDVYRGIVQNFREMAQELSSGLAIALALTWHKHAGPPQKDVSLVDALRELTGPGDPDMARAAAPGSLRARFGEGGARNAVHVTDLPQDGRLEAAFFFGA